MNNIQNIKKLLLPYIKGSVVVVFLVIFAVSLTYRALNYVVPKYESTTKIKIENNSEGVSSLNLYKNFDVFSMFNKVKTEEEILKSDELLSLVVGIIDEPVRYFRIGEMRTSEMYTETPFVVESYDITKEFYNKDIAVTFLNDSSYSLSYSGVAYYGIPGEPLALPDGWLKITLQKHIIEDKGEQALYGNLYFKILSEKAQIGLIKKSINVSSIDKDIPIIRISYKDEVAARTALVVNTVADCYISDYVSNKSLAAEKTVNFISKQLDVVAEDLNQSELALEEFKRKYNVVNTRQETETGLKEISQLQLNLIGLQVESAAMDSVLVSLENEETLQPISTNFEAFSDLTYTEIINDVNELLAERRKLLLKYQSDNERVVLVEDRIMELKDFLKEGIQKSKQSVHVKILNLQSKIDVLSGQFEDLPEREKKLVILERDFQLNQKIYNFLSEKRIESSIVQAATISFHRIIQRGSVPTKPVSPNKKFLSIIAGFLVVMVSFLFIYLKTNFASRTESREEVEKQSAIPVIGIIPKMKRNANDILTYFGVLVTELLAKDKIKRQQILTFTSSSRKEGKTFVAQHTAHVFAGLGWRTLLVDYNIHNKALSNLMDNDAVDGLLSHYTDADKLKTCVKEVAKNLCFLPCGEMNSVDGAFLNPEVLADAVVNMKKDYDVIVVDTPANTITNEAVMLFKQSDCVVQILRSGRTHTHMISQADLLADTYQLDNLNLLVNFTSRAYNYSGLLTGSRFTYGQEAGILPAIRRYIDIYLRW